MNTVKAWTDYPMKELGDSPGKKAADWIVDKMNSSDKT